jgi:hypothetical protein
LTTGIENSIESNSKIEVFPNPFLDKINVKNTSENEFLILEDYFGKVIWSGRNIENHDFSYISNGLYFLKVDNYTIKLIKQ